MIQIRKANTWDTVGIAAVRRHTWPEEDTSEVQIAKTLSETEHYAIVATAKGRIVGYLSCFPTQSQDHRQRWELDELAVDPEFRQQGIGKALIAQGVEVGMARGAEVFRALVETDNIASQACFAAHDFQQSTPIYRLYIYPGPARVAKPVPTTVYPIAVSTFSYSGIWLEGALSQEALKNAIGLLREVDLVGVLISQEQSDLWAKAEGFGFKNKGDYHWWTK